MRIVTHIWCMVLLTDNLLPFILAGFYPRFHAKEMALSVLGSRQSPVRTVYNLWCIFSGVIFCIAPYAQYRESSDNLTLAIWILLAIYGVGCEILSGFFPLNESKEAVDTITKIHGGASAIGFMALLFVPLLLAIIQLRTNAVGIGILSLVFFLLSFLFFCFFIMGEKEKFATTVLRYGGLWQRLVLASCYMPLVLWCIGK